MRNILPVLALLYLSGCSTIIAGDTRLVEIKSEPSGLLVEILDHEGQEIDSGITPFTIELKRGRGYFQASDYSLSIPRYSYEEPINYAVTGWYAVGNLVFGGLVGWLVVDPLTGAMYDIPGEITLKPLEPESAESRERPSGYKGKGRS